MHSPRDRLPIIYQELADLTRPECAGCPAPHSCCSEMYCEMAREWAATEWGVTLQDTGHATLPFMGASGCTVPPHLRPLCTVHTCKIASLGSSGREGWDARYFHLRDLANELEAERMGTD